MSSSQLSRPLAQRVTRLEAFTEQSWANPQSRPTLISSVEAALDASQTHYTDVVGITVLRDRIAAQLSRRYNLALSAEDILITCGAAEARFIAFRQLLQPGDEIFCSGSTEAIRALAHFLGVELVHNVEDAQHIRMAYLSPHDGKKAFDALMPLIEAQGWPLLWEMNMGRETYHPAQNAEIAAQVISIGNLDHALPGWRIGWLVKPGAIHEFSHLKQMMTICSASISQWAAAGWFS